MSAKTNSRSNSRSSNQYDATFTSKERKEIRHRLMEVCGYITLRDLCRYDYIGFDTDIVRPAEEAIAPIPSLAQLSVATKLIMGQRVAQGIGRPMIGLGYLPNRTHSAPMLPKFLHAI